MAGTQTERGCGRHDPAWEVVYSWPGLGGGAALAWYYLWRLAGFRPATVRVTARELGASRGRSADAGLRDIRELLDHNLIKQVDAVARGIWTLRLCEPREVCFGPGETPDDQARIDYDPAPRGAPVDVRVDGQEAIDQAAASRDAEGQPLWDDRPPCSAKMRSDEPAASAKMRSNAGSSSAKMRSEDEPSSAKMRSKTDAQYTRAHAGAGARATSVTSINSVNETYTSTSSAEAQPQRATSAGAPTLAPRDADAANLRRGDPGSAKTRGERPIGGIFAERLAAILDGASTPAERLAKREELVRFVLDAVDDRRLHVSPALRWADALIDERIEERVLHGLLAQVASMRRTGLLIKTPSCYFTIASIDAFHDRGCGDLWPLKPAQEAARRKRIEERQRRAQEKAR